MKRKRGRGDFQYHGECPEAEGRGKSTRGPEAEERGRRRNMSADMGWIADDEDRARRKYKKDLDLLKPDLIAYNRQKEQALGLAPGTLVKSIKPAADEGGQGEGAEDKADPGSGSASKGKEVLVAGPSSVTQRLAAENLYRDANSLVYADNKPSEEVIDKLVEKLNKEYVVFLLSPRSLFLGSVPCYPLPAPSPLPRFSLAAPSFIAARSLSIAPLAQDTNSHTAKTSATNSRANVPIRTTSLSPTSTRRIGCSIARSVSHFLLGEGGADMETDIEVLR